MDERPEGNDFEHEKIRRLQRAMYSRSVGPKLRPRSRRELDAMQHSVPRDWEEPTEEVAPSFVAPGTVRTARTVLMWFLAIAVLFFVASAGFFFYYFTLGAGSTAAAPENIDIVVRGPLSVTGGEPAELQVVVTNRNQVALELADLIITYPPGTRSPADFVTDLPRQRIALGAIEAGGRRQGTVSAVFIGQEGVREPIHVELEYRVADSSAIFVAKTEYALTFNASPLAVTIEGNDEVVSGQQMLITARIRSNADTTLKDVVLEGQAPFGFRLASFEPSSVREGQWTWELGDIRPGEERVIKVRGTLEGQERDERIFRFTAGVRRDPENTGVDVVLAEGVQRVALARPFIGLSIALNKQGEEVLSIAPGETVNVQVRWANNLSTAVTNVVLVARLTGLDIDATSVRTTDGFYRSSDNTILWDKSTTQGVFTTVAPGASGVVNFSFEVPPEEDLLTVRESQFDISVHAAGKRVSESGVPETLQATAKQEVKLASNIQFVGQAFYYANPFGSTGPLPPTVDEETTYAIVLTLANTSNAVEKVKLTGVLPPYVRWLGAYLPGSEGLKISSVDGLVEWDVGTVAPGVGVGGTAPRQVAFSVGITPSASQIGQEPALITDLRMEGVDTFTNAKVVRTYPNVTTNLVDDPGFSVEESQVAPAQ